jgi:hypothetical protein
MELAGFNLGAQNAKKGSRRLQPAFFSPGGLMAQVKACGYTKTALAPKQMQLV